MRRIWLSVLAGVALIGVAIVLLHSAGPSLSQPTGPASVQLAAAPSSRLAPSSPQLTAASPGLRQRLSRFLLVHTLFGLPSSGTVGARRASAIGAAPLIRPVLPDGMTCPVATGSGGASCSIVPCAVYVGAAQASYAAAASAIDLVAIPQVIGKPSPGGSTPAGTCVSRPGRPPQTRWVSSTDR